MSKDTVFEIDTLKRIDYFRKVYRALHLLGDMLPWDEKEMRPMGGMLPGDICITATASLRLLMVDAFGEERQKELIGQWNEDNRQMRKN